MSNKIDLGALSALADLVNIIKNGETKEELQKEEAQKEEVRAEEKRSEAEDEAKKAEKAQKEFEEKSKQTEEANKKAQEEAEKAEQEREQAQNEREERYIKKSLATEFEKAGIDTDVVESISGFIDYGRLKNDDNEADEEKITEFAELLGRVSRRQPPKGKGGKRAIDDDGGIAKYLQEK